MLVFLDPQSAIAINFHFKNHQKPQISLNSTEKGVTYILEKLRVSELKANVNFWLNFPLAFL